MCRREAQRLLRACGASLGLHSCCPSALTSLGGDPLRSPLLCDPILSEPALPQLLPPCFSRNLTSLLWQLPEQAFFPPKPLTALFCLSQVLSWTHSWIQLCPKFLS